MLVAQDDDDGIDFANFKRRGVYLVQRETARAGKRIYKIRDPLLSAQAAGWITPRQYNAGERFRDIWEGCQHVGGPNYDGVPPPQQTSSRIPSIPVLEAVGEWSLMRRSIGVTALVVLIDFIENGIPKLSRAQRDRRRGKVTLVLDILADRWNIL